MPTYTDERVLAVLRGKRAPRTIPFPGAPLESGIVVAVRLLTEAELDHCRLNAQGKLRTYCESKKWDPTTAVDMDPAMMGRYVEREIVFLAFLDADTAADKEPKRFFPTMHDVEALDAATLTRLREAYDEHQDWTSPLARMSDEDVRGFVDVLGNASSVPAELQRFERSTLVRLCISLASRLRSTTSPMNKSSPGPTSSDG